MENAALQKLILALILISLATLIEMLIPLRDSLRKQSLPGSPQHSIGKARIRVNISFIFLTLSLGLTCHYILVIGASALSLRGFGLLPALGFDGVFGVVVAIIFLDLATYAGHVLMHKSKYLWRIHRLHHMDCMVDASTALRQHPLEAVFRFSVITLTALRLGVTPEAIALYRALSLANAVAEHANIKVPTIINNSLIWFWVTPGMHKIHHSKLQLETDSNYSNLFSFFDRLLGTFTSTKGRELVEYGLEGFDKPQQHTFAAALLIPFKGDLLDHSIENKSIEVGDNHRNRPYTTHRP